MKNINFISLSILSIFLNSSCSQNPEPWIDEEAEKGNQVSVGLKFNSFNAEEPSAPAKEANWTHIVSIFQNNADESKDCISYIKADNAKGVDSFLLSPADYTLAAFAISDINAVILPDIENTADFLSTSNISINPESQTPEIVYTEKLISVSEASVIEIKLTRIVGQLAMRLTNVPTTPVVDRIVVEIPQLYDAFSFDGKYSASTQSNNLTSKSILLKRDPGKDTYSNVYDKENNVTAGTILMPSIAEDNMLELYLTLHYEDKTIRRLKTNTYAKIKANTQLKINASLSNTPAQIVTNFSYAPWSEKIDSVDILFPFDDDLSGIIEVDPKAPIGTLIRNGIVFSPGKLVSIDTPSDTLTWNGANNWAIARGTNWKIPTIDEWNEIENVLGTLRKSLETIQNSEPFVVKHKYWTESEFAGRPGGKAIHIIEDTSGKYWTRNERRHRVRAIYVAP